MGSIQSAITRCLIKKSGLWNRPLEEIRAIMTGIAPKGYPAGVNEDATRLDGVPCPVFIPAAAKPGRAVLYFHGGGFCLGIYPANRAFAALIAKEAGLPVYMPDYRLAPENPFPAALEDAVAALKGIYQNSFEPECISVLGDSSGCALALSAMLVLKQSGYPIPGAVILITPVLDIAGRGESFVTRATKDPFRLRDPLALAKLYCGQNNPSSPAISPLYGELAGLPPMLIHAADCDVFLSDALRLADAAAAVRVQAEIKIWKNMWHIFHMQAPFVRESREAVAELCAFLKNHGKSV